MNKYMLFVCAACLLAACEKPVFGDTGEDDYPSVVVPGDSKLMGEVL